MKKAREELGAEARLIGARRVSPPDLPAVYEVEVVAGPPEEPQGPGIDAIREELRSLRRTISTLRSEPSASPPAGGASGPRDPAYVKWFEMLRSRGVGRVHAERIVEAALGRASGEEGADPYEALNQVVAEQLGDASAVERPGKRSTVLVGPAGAGKTTVLAKIAADLVRDGERPVLVSADGESLSGEENVHAIAEALGLPFATAFLPGQMESVVERFGAGARYLVDTPGRAALGPDRLAGIEALVRALPGAEVLLVLPATTDGEEARLVIEEFQAFGVDRVVLTKLDELHRPGRIVDLAKAVSRPIARITYGKAVQASSAPGDPRVVSRILGSPKTVNARA
jgi:flagellar biosynthesis protein FlhF